uniref:C2H2-type domain-containing protein n=1 Tax=Oryza nivara TaxID=4536 RepID=A0A0E0GJF7_ORYNI
MALVKSHHQMLASSSTSSSSPSSQQQQPPPPASNSSSLAAAAADQPSPAKRKRRPPGTPDPDAEVVALSPRTLLESDRYVCEICGQGFQREQNLQMHRRRHKVPWRLVKRPAAATAAEDGGAAGGGGGAGGGAGGGGARKRVFVCPEPSCLHHDPAHALGDLVGIKKHFRRKHGGRRQWVCARCAKGYAVQSDYKAHLKTCGTRGHSCDCGRVFSRVESFIEHQDACNSGRVRGEVVPVATTLPVIPPPGVHHGAVGRRVLVQLHDHHDHRLLPRATRQQAITMNLQLSIGPAAVVAAASGGGGACAAAAGGEEEQQREEVRRALEEKTAADAARERAREEAAAAERALEDARRARHRARGELEKALALRDHAARLIAQVTCHACRQRSLAVMSMAAIDGHGASAVAREHLRGGGVGAGI